MITSRNLIAGVILLSIVLNLQAQHYPMGSEGIKAGSLPPAGFTITDDNSFYFSDHMPGFGGQLNGLKNFTYTQTPRAAWLIHLDFLDGNFGMAIRVPLVYKQIAHEYGVATSGNPIGTFPGSPSPSGTTHTQRQFGLGDIEVAPILLSWNLKHFDLSTGYSFWAPTGDYDKNKFFINNIGDGYWTHSFMIGVTWYPDFEKTWAISLLNHFDINTEQYSSSLTVPVSPSAPQGVASVGTTLGDIDTLECAVSKTIIKGVDVGLTGYYQQQVTATQGPTFNGPTWQSERIHVGGIGPEIKYTCEKWGLSAALRYDYEFTATDHAQGQLINLTVSKLF